MIPDSIACVPEGSVPPGFTRPSKSYKRSAWIAFLALAAFAVFYLGLTWWFAATAYRHIYGGIATNRPEYNIFAGIMAALLAVFMAKALFFVKRGAMDGVIEVKREDEPALFAFIESVADSVKAPRPHKVFLSPEVNAAVSYDLSPVNLIIPSRKNLIIGLGLVNSLNAAEFKAVLAHEFGHFSQRTMAVGRWVYIGQQIAGHIIAKRDALDALISGLSRIDLRVAWIGWILSVVIWSIRAVTETVFRGVILAQRALSREMEFNADLVAVSITGSDHLINGLHRMGPADDAWNRSVDFINDRFRDKWKIEDIYSVQTRILEHMRTLLAEPAWGASPAVPEEGRGQHRLFDKETDPPHGMWMTHPPHRDREDNAKRTYIPASPGGPAAWDLFARADHWRKAMTALMYKTIKRPDTKERSTEDALRDLDAQFTRESLAPEHLGIYHDRYLFRSFTRAEDILDRNAFAYNTLDAARPESLRDTLKRSNRAEAELAGLKAIKPGVNLIPGGGIRHRGKPIRSSELPGLIATITKETEDLRAEIAAHDRMARSVHFGAAASIGMGWDARLEALLGILHYAEHSLLNLHDAHRAFLETFSEVTARGRISDAGRNQLLNAASGLHDALRRISEHRDELKLDETLTKRLGKGTWAETLETFKLGPMSLESADSWINAVPGWVESFSGSLERLRQAALDQLLNAEREVRRMYADDTARTPAPTTPSSPKTYPTLPYGKERTSYADPGPWDSFMGSGAFGWSALRVSAALAILVALVGTAHTTTSSKLHIFNGLACTVRADVNGTELLLKPGEHRRIETEAGRPHIRTTTAGGALIEEFDGETAAEFTQAVYNIAHAGILVEWYASYGPGGGGAQRKPTIIGAPRWYRGNSDHMFEEPPASISMSKHSGVVTRSVLAAQTNIRPQSFAANASPDDLRAAVRAHARFDDAAAQETISWVSCDMTPAERKAVIAVRLAANPTEIMSLRLEQDTATAEEWPEVARRQNTLATAHPENPDLLYLAIRTHREDEEKQDKEFIDAYERHRDHPWLANAAGYSFGRLGRYEEANRAFMAAIGYKPLTDTVAEECARLRRFSGTAKLDDLTSRSQRLRYTLALESPQPAPGDDPMTLSVKAIQAGELAKVATHVEPDRIEVLAAASDGANPDTVNRVANIPPDKLADPVSIQYAMALSRRLGKDTAPHADKLAKIYGVRGAPMGMVLSALKPDSDTAEIEKQIERLNLHDRGYAYAFGCVVMGERAPAAWRDKARRLLFAYERPYFR